MSMGGFETDDCWHDHIDDRASLATKRVQNIPGKQHFFGFFLFLVGCSCCAGSVLRITLATSTANGMQATTPMALLPTLLSHTDTLSRGGGLWQSVRDKDRAEMDAIGTSRPIRRSQPVGVVCSVC
uniref:Uncharacterized protein n=1 Tax=Anopheles culicifacies TaxID=139723 RepID=A0A182M951_9DIPT